MSDNSICCHKELAILPTQAQPCRTPSIPILPLHPPNPGRAETRPFPLLHPPIPGRAETRPFPLCHPPTLGHRPIAVAEQWVPDRPFPLAAPRRPLFPFAPTQPCVRQDGRFSPCREKVPWAPFRCLKINARSLGPPPAMDLSYGLRRVSWARAGSSVALFLSSVLGIDPAS